MHIASCFTPTATRVGLDAVPVVSPTATSPARSGSGPRCVRVAPGDASGARDARDTGDTALATGAAVRAAARGALP